MAKTKNYELGKTGIMRFSHNRMFKKRATYRRRKAGLKSLVDAAISGDKKPAATPKMVSKQIGGDKNGGKRLVRAHRMARSYPTQEAARKLKRANKQCFSQHTRKLRDSITPGTVLILLAGLHKGKRVVFLKQLDTGLLLVTGPFQINACPLRRINQRYVIATSTKLNLPADVVPANINDAYFKRVNLKKVKHGEGEIFDQEKKEYKVSEERKADQRKVDKAVLDALRGEEDRKLLLRYLGAQFSLQNKSYPHKMKF